MKRAVGNKRRKVIERQAQIYNCVAILTMSKGYATVTDLARALDMTPSTHLKNIALTMYRLDMIDLTIHKKTNGRKVYRFYLGDARVNRIKENCHVPWKCPQLAQRNFYVGCTVKDMGIARDCPVWLRDAANARKADEKKIHKGVPIRWKERKLTRK